MSSYTFDNLGTIGMILGNAVKLRNCARKI